MATPRTRTRPRTGVVLMALGSATVAATLFTPSARAAGSFQAAAIAEGVRYTVTVPGAPLSDQIADAGGPVAQASLDSLGTSRGFASLPYPGDTATGLPGLVAGFTGGMVIGTLAGGRLAQRWLLLAALAGTVATGIGIGLAGAAVVLWQATAAYGFSFPEK